MNRRKENSITSIPEDSLNRNILKSLAFVRARLPEMIIPFLEEQYQ